jgi:putative flippase GtrA
MPLRQFTVYVFVGVLTTIIDIGSMQLLLGLGYSTTLAVSTGFLLALAFNYVTHQRVTFRAVHSAGTLMRFGVLVVVNYGLTLLCVHAGEHWLDSALAGKLASLPLVTLNGFLAGRYWVFQQKDPGNDQ